MRKFLKFVFGIKLYMSRTVPLSIIRSFSLYTQQWYITGLLTACELSANCPDNGQRNCPKYVEFYSKNKFEKLVHLVGFIIRICQDAWSPERQNTVVCCHSLRRNNYFDINILYVQCSYVMQAVRNSEKNNCRYYKLVDFLQTKDLHLWKFVTKPNNLKAGWFQHMLSVDFWMKRNNWISCCALRIILISYNKASVKEQGRKLLGNMCNYLTIDTVLEYLSPYSGSVLSHDSVLSDIVHFWHVLKVTVAVGILRR